MTAEEILIQTEQAGCHLVVRNGSLLVNGKLTEDLRSTIREHKAELMTLIKTRQEAACNQVTGQLTKQGYVAIRSSFLGETVIFLQDSKVPVPSRWKSVVCYTLSELKELVAGTVDPNGLKQINIAKKLFKGKVISNEDGNVEIIPSAEVI